MSTENLCSVTEQATVQAMVESINNGMIHIPEHTRSLSSSL